jgi:ABC-type sugar transport system substrate-binding protein
VLGTVIVAAFVLGSCGSSKKAAGTGSSTSAGSGAPTSAGSGATTTARGGVDIEAVKKQVALYEQGPTKYLGPTEPVTVKKGIKLATIPCAGVVRGCVRPVEEAGKIAKELGWDVTSYDGKGTPKDNNSAVEQAVAGGADVILTGGIDPTFIQGGLQSAKDKKVLVASMSQGVGPTANGYKFDIGADYTLLGKMIGDYVIADSKGTAVMLPFDDKSFASALAFVAGAVDEVKTCSTCTVLDREYFVSTDIPTPLGPRAVDLVRKNSKITYIMGDYDPAVAAIVPALANAGLDKVKVMGGLANQQNLEFVKAGHIQTADAGFDNTYMAYMAIYQINLLLNNQPLWVTPGESRPEYMYSGGVPVRLFTTENPPATTDDYVATDTLDYLTPMRKLLGLT